jgi:hypothetical protein
MTAAAAAGGAGRHRAEVLSGTSTDQARPPAAAAAAWLDSGLGHRSACVLPLGGRRSSLTVTVATGFWANRALRVARRRGQAVVNIGDEAFLFTDRICVVRCGSQIMKLILRDAPGPDSARSLVRLAGLAVDRVERLAAKQRATGPTTASAGGL